MIPKCARCFQLAAMASTFLAGLCAAETQVELNEKADKEFQAADKKLNDVYKQLVATLEAIDKASPGNSIKAKLVVAQRAWIKFRDAEAQAEIAAYGDGSIVPLVYSNALTQMTVARTKSLVGRLTELRARGWN